MAHERHTRAPAHWGDLAPDQDGSRVIIFGTRRTARLLAMQVLTCAHCGREAMQRLSLHTAWFALFFIPLIPYSRRRVFRCAYCGEGTELDEATADRFVTDAEATQAQLGGQGPAIVP